MATQFSTIRETLSDAAKMVCISGAFGSACIIAWPVKARAAHGAVSQDFTIIPNVALLTLALVMVGTMMLLAIFAIIDHAKYSPIERARIAARRAELRAETQAF